MPLNWTTFTSTPFPTSRGGVAVVKRILRTRLLTHRPTSLPFPPGARESRASPLYTILAHPARERDAPPPPPSSDRSHAHTHRNATATCSRHLCQLPPRARARPQYQ